MIRQALSPRALFRYVVLALAGSAAIPCVVAQSELIITEINYHPTDMAENLEFVEIKNVGDEPQNMTGYTMGGVGTVTFTQSVIQPGEFLVVAKSAAVFQGTYGFFPGGTYSGSLKNSGEEVEIVDPAMNSVFSVDYWDGDDEDPLDPDDDERPLWPSLPDTDDYTLVPQNPNVNSDPNDYRNWRPSINLGGSPGTDEPLPDPLLAVFINEIRTRDGEADNDAIEFFNPNAADVNIGDWFLSDNLDNPTKSPVPDGTIVPAGGYLVLENGVNDFSISLSSKGERVFLYSGNSAGELTGFVNGLHFGASGDGQTFGRYINSDGAEQFPAATPTLGSENASPSVGPVVITELMYDPGTLGGTDEFIEIQNISDSTVQLFDPNRTTNNWRIEGINYVIVGSQPTLAPGEIALVTPTAPATFRAAHGVPAGIQIFGAYSGSAFSDGGEEVALQRPENLDDMDVNQTSYINVDVMLYDNKSPWPPAAAGGGRSLVRTDRAGYGNDPSNWQPSLLLGGSPGVIYDYSGPDIRVNEILAHSDIPLVDVIELYNPTDSAVDIGGWFLTDNKDSPMKFEIPAGSTIPPMGFWAVNQDNDGNEGGAPLNYFGNAFQISSRGDSIWLYGANGAGGLNGYRHGFQFRATENGSDADGGFTLGRYVDSFGREHLTTQTRSFAVNLSTPNPAGAANNPPVVGPLVFTEINFDPADGEPEFIELTNISTRTVNLFDSSAGGNPANNWALDGVTFTFTGNRPAVPAGASIIILPQGTDSAAFRAANNVPAEPAAYVIGGARGYVGALNNGGEELVLLKPDAPDFVDGGIIVPMMVVDLINYGDSSHWPSVAPGETLEKINPSGFSDDPVNWRASAAIGGSPGTVPEALTYGIWAQQNFTTEELEQAGLTDCDGDVNGDGYTNLIAYGFGYDPHLTPAAELLPAGEILSDSGANYLAISFRRQLMAADLSYAVETSTDLNSWVADGDEVGTPVDNGDGTETVQVRTADAIDGEARRVLRVRITKQ